MLELLTTITIAVAVAAFVAGVLLTVFSGTFRTFRLTLITLTCVLGLAVVIGMVFTRGLLIFLTFQLISVVIIAYFVMLIGALCGYGAHVLIHKKPPGSKLTADDLADYLPALEFATLEKIDEDRALSRIKSGYYRGGRYQGAWYVHKAELTQPKPA